jgi:nucleoside-diphosphate-sugar epimerase
VSRPTVYILGASGFVGGRLLSLCRERGEYQVVGLSREDCDLLDLRKVLSVLGRMNPVDILVYTAAITRLKANTFEAMLDNIRMADNVAQAIAVASLCHVVFMSTIDVYGIRLPPATQITEDTLIDPDDYYSVSKIAGEYLLGRVCAKLPTRLTVFRLSGIYGPGDRLRSTPGLMMGSALRQGLITVYGDGHNLRDFVYVDDLYPAVFQAVKRQAGVTFNLAAGSSCSIRETAEMICSVVPGPVRVEYKPGNESQPRRVEHLVFNTTRLRQYLPDLALTPLRDGLSRYVTAAAQYVAQEARPT